MTPRTRFSSGSPFERPIGFSRAVRVGNLVAVSGTAPLGPDGKTVAPGDLYRQTVRCLEIIVEAVAGLGGKKEDILRTRIFLTDVSRWEEAARAHGEFFSEVRPASTFVGISALIGSDWLVEIEADGVVE